MPAFKSSRVGPDSVKNHLGSISVISAEASGTIINIGDLVTVSKVVGGGAKMYVKLANEGETGPLWVARTRFDGGQRGIAADWHILADVDTSAYAEQDPWYAGASGSTSGVPGLIGQRVGTVLTVSATEGKVLIRPAGSFGSSFTALRTLTAAEINGLFGANLEVVAAPGAGLAILVDEVVYRYNHVTTGPTAGAGEDLVLLYNTAGTAACTAVDDAVFNGAAADKTAVVKGLNPQVLNAAETNVGVDVAVLTGAWTGTADSTMDVAVTYRIVAI